MDIYYLNSKNDKIYLDRYPFKMLTDTDAFDYEWSYEQKNNRIRNIERALKTPSVNIVVSGNNQSEYKENLEKLIECIECDIVSGTTGRLYFGDYYLPCFFCKSKKPDKYINVKKSMITLSLVSSSASWIRDEQFEFRYAEQEEDTSGHGYPYGYDYDYAASTGYTSQMSCSAIGDSDFILTIYGYASNPEIAIGDNVYRLNYTIQKGEIVKLDTKEQTIMLLKSNGIIINLFAYRDLEHYIFTRIKTGEQKVYWNGKFDFDIMLKNERSEPTWT